MSTAAAQDYTSSVMPNYSGQLTYPAYSYPANALTSTLYAPSAVASYNQTYNNAALAATAQLQPGSINAYNFSMGISQVSLSLTRNFVQLIHDI
jgi:hypothetical protein